MKEFQYTGQLSESNLETIITILDTFRYSNKCSPTDRTKIKEVLSKLQDFRGYYEARD
ncbi:MAG: hypothetical protein OXF77_00905 [Thaumarchaeota archaeon]|nr:hypothetical protein [Nitrososphaerota archaeon]